MRQVIPLHEVRTNLEVQAAGCAAGRRTEEELRGIEATLQEMHAHTDDDQTRALNRQFPLEVALAAHNSVIENVLSRIVSTSKEVLEAVSQRRY